MDDQVQRFQKRWEFRRTGNDFNSSSDEDHLRSISSNEPKAMKHKLVTGLLKYGEQNTHSPTSPPFSRGEKENHSNFEKSDRKRNKQGEANERNGGSRASKKVASDDEPPNAAVIDLTGYMESLVEGIKSARKDLLTWMNNEINSSSKDDDITAPKPSRTRKGQRQNAKSGKTPAINKPNNSRRKRAVKIAKNGEDGSSGRRSSKTNGEVVVPERENFVIVIPVEKTEKQKGKNSRVSSKKQKVVGTSADKQADKDADNASSAATAAVAATAAAAATDNSTRYTTVVPPKQVENSERNLLETGNDRRTLNSMVNVNSHQLNFDLRAQKKDALFSQNGLNNASDYEKIMGPTICNVNGNDFPFPFASQGLNSGVGMRNIPSQFGLQYLAQGNRMSGVYTEPPRFPNANHEFMGSYGAFNQPMKFDVQQGGVMGLKCPDIIRGVYNQRNIADQ